MPTDADFMFSQLQVLFPINPYPTVMTPVSYINASHYLSSEEGNILLDGHITNSCLTNTPLLKFNASAMNISATTIGINGSLVNSKLSSDVPSLWFNGSSCNLSCTLLSSNGGIVLTDVSSDGIPTSNAAVSAGATTWATAGRVYIYTGTDVHGTSLKYLCVV